jgi:hypothetical protein
LIHPEVTTYYVNGKVKNLSDETLSAHITVEFLDETGAVEQTQSRNINDIAPGEEKSFSVASITTFVAISGFNVYVESWE